MTIHEFLVQEYKATKQMFEDLKAKETTHDYKKQENYVHTTKSITQLLLIIRGNQEDAYAVWLDGLHLLLINCKLDNKKPLTEMTDLGYGYNVFENFDKEQLIMQYLEGYIAVQSSRIDPIGYIELAIKLNLIKLKR